MILEKINNLNDIKEISKEECVVLAQEIRTFQSKTLVKMVVI